MTSLTDRPYVVLGDGGHAAVVADLLLSIDAPILGVTSPDQTQGRSWFNGIECIGNDEQIKNYSPDDIYLALGIGDNGLRQSLYENMVSMGYVFPGLAHPAATVSTSVKIENGSVVMAGAIIQARSVLGKGIIVNTSASVDHDCKLSDFSHVAPGSHLCGGVSVGTRTLIGSGAIVIQEIDISADKLVKAGSCVTKSQM